MSEHEQVVQRQFGEQASAYLNSTVHAQGTEFSLLQAAVSGRSDARVLGLALREARRVLKPGGVAAFIDVMAPGLPLLDTHLQTVEVLRDTSHVRDYSAAEWLQQVGAAGLQVTRHSRQRLHIDFASWVERMRTPEVFRQAILALQQSVGDEVREYFEVAADGSFSIDVLVLWAER